MEYKDLGTTGLKVSRIGFGCMSLQPDSANNEKLLHQAIADGINYFDTADLYDKGLNEEIVGKALKPKRKDVIIATKVGNQWRADGSGWDWNPSKAYILSCAEKSLQRLQTDYIDLYQLHGGTMDDPIDETISAFEQLKQEGKIRHYGISSIRPSVTREWVKRSNIVSVMLQYSLLDRRPEETTLNLLKENNKAVFCRGSIAQGLLVDKPAKAYLNYSGEEVEKARKAVENLALPHRNNAQTALKFVLQHDAVTAPIVGIRTLEQLKEAVGAVSSPDLTAEEMQVLRSAIPINRYTEHR